MKKPIAIIFLLTFLVGFFSWGESAKAQVGAGVYTSVYSNTNVYAPSFVGGAGNPIIYQMSGLDATHEYVWTFAKADPTTAGPTETIGVVTHSGATTATLTVGIANTDFTWPINYTGPMIMFDDFGTVRGRHFIAPDVLGSAAIPSDWELDTAQTANLDKQTVGVAYHLDPCPNPAYTLENSDGWHHTFSPCSIQASKSDYLILHYRFDAATDYGNNDEIHFYNMPGSVEEFVLNIDDLADYQDGGWSGGITDLHTRNFVVLNTNGDSELLPFIDQIQADSNVSATYDNPSRLDFELGAYNCTRTDVSNNWISDCESPILISNKSPNLNIPRSQLGSFLAGNFTSTQLALEWGLRPLISDIAINSIQTVEFTHATEEIWDAYNGSYAFISVVQGTLDTSLYGYSDQRFDSFTTSGIVQPDILTWSVTPSGINSGAMTASEARFITAASYNTITEGQFTQDLNEGLAMLRLDTPLGNLAAMIGILLIGLVSVGSWTIAQNIPTNFSIFLQMIVFAGLGGMWIMFGLANQLTIVFYVGSLLIMVAFFWMTLKGGSSDAEMV